jgi:hypothetical protein
MRESTRRRTLAWVALAALVCVSAALVEESFIHTDDGCNVVEIHCIACRLAAGSTAVVSPAIVLPVAVQTTALVVAEADSSLCEAAPHETPSRAPPLA